MTGRIGDLLSRARLPQLERQAWIEVDVDTLVANSTALCQLSQPAQVAAVVKADGYGHGLEMAARCAVAGGASWLCVATWGEAIRLRSDGYRGRMFVLYPIPTARISEAADLGIDISIGDLATAHRVADEPPTSGSRLSIHIEVDSGMTRGGVPPEQALAAAQAIDSSQRVELGGVWTHLSTPEDPEITVAQMAIFDQALAELRDAGVDPGQVHVLASGGILAADNSGHTLVRPGLIYYGLHPGAGRALPDTIRPALELKALPVRVANIPQGTRVGYAGTWKAERPATIATLPLGYVDGWSRVSSPGTSALVEGKRAPLVGRISSDSLTLDVTDADITQDSELVLIGNSGSETVTADDIAEVRGTISWEVLQQLGTRLTRIYLSKGEAIALRPESSQQLITAGNRDLVTDTPASYDRYG